MKAAAPVLTAPAAGRACVGAAVAAPAAPAAAGSGHFCDVLAGSHAASNPPPAGTAPRADDAAPAASKSTPSVPSVAASPAVPAPAVPVIGAPANAAPARGKAAAMPPRTPAPAQAKLDSPASASTTGTEDPATAEIPAVASNAGASTAAADAADATHAAAPSPERAAHGGRSKSAGRSTVAQDSTASATPSSAVVAANPMPTLSLWWQAAPLPVTPGSAPAEEDADETSIFTAAARATASMAVNTPPVPVATSAANANANANAAAALMVPADDTGEGNTVLQTPAPTPIAATILSSSSSPGAHAGAAGGADTTAAPVDVSALASLVRALPGESNPAGTSGRAISVPVSDPSWPRAVAAQVQMFAAGGIQSATLRLSPEHLGPLQVHLDMQPTQINVSFVAAHAETRSALEQSVPMLRAMMAHGGLTLGQTQVQGDTRSGSQFANEREPSALGVAPVDEPGASGSSRTLGLIDEYA